MAERSTLREQLRPVAQKIFKQVPRQIPIVQIIADLSGEDQSAAMSLARNESLKWLQKRSGKLPESAWDHNDFENNLPGASSSGVRINNDNTDYWSGRLDFSDNNVAGRTWTTEITIASGGTFNRAMFGLRLTVATRETEPDFLPTVPGIVRQITETPGLERRGLPLRETPLIIETQDVFDQFLDLLGDPKRRCPIYAVSLPEGEHNIESAAIDVCDLSRRCLGTAHIFIFPSQSTYWLSDHVGKEFSVFRRAVRTYKPGCDFLTDSPYSHPLALPEKINAWGQRGSADFVDFLVREAARETLTRITVENELPSFANVKNFSLQIRREEAKKEGESERDLLALAEMELEEVRRDAEAWESLAQGEENARLESENKLDHLSSQNHWLNERIAHLEQQLKDTTGRHTDDDIEIPDNFNDLRQWAEKNFPGLIFITGKAQRASKHSSYENIHLVFRALMLLAREYRNMKLGEGRESFEKKLCDLGLECSPSFAGSRVGEQGDEYFVKHKGKRHLLDMHLKKGTSREPRHCLRIYFFWDEEGQQVVVGSLPGHLTTRAT